MTERYFQNLIISNSKLVFFLFDPVSKELKHLSPGYKRLWELEFPELTLSNVLATIPQEDQEYLKKVIKKLTPDNSFSEDLHFKITTRTNQQKHLVTWVGILNKDNNDLPLIGGVISDFTKRKKYEEVILDYSSRKDAMLETLIHDLSAPLKMVDNITLVLEEKHLSGKLPELREYTDFIRKVCQTSVSLIENLTHNEYLETSGVELKLERVDIVHRIKSNFEIYKKGAVNKKNFYIDSDSEEIIVQIDDIKFIQVINNLLSNAIKFTPENGDIRVVIKERPETVLLTISDNGVGIPEKSQQHIFEKFSKARRRGLNGEPTVGLGLYIVKKIIEMHKGKIWFTSKEGQGSTFNIEIPKFAPQF